MCLLDGSSHRFLIGKGPIFGAKAHPTWNTELQEKMVV